MLKLFQNQGKVLRWTMGVILFLVAGSMVITLVPNVFGPAGPGAPDVLAEVAGVTVTTGDVELELREHRANNVPPEAISMLASTAIDSLIAERVLFSEAAALGLVPSEEELAQWIREQLPDVLFPGGEYIGGDAYQRFVRQQFRRTVPEFERDLLEQIAIGQNLRQLVTDSVRVTEEEVAKRYHERNDAVQIEWAAIAASSVASEVSPTEEQLRQYFESNRLRYRHPERRPLQLITIAPDSAASDVEITEAEVQLYYGQNEYRFENPERVKLRHILFMTLEKAEEEQQQALEDAEGVLAELRAGGDFEALAREHSEDPGNADKGGDLGWVSRGMMDPAFEEAGFALQDVGEISSAPVKSEFGYHLIRLDDRQAPSVKPLEEVRDVIVDDLRAERSQGERFALIERAMTAAEESGGQLSRVAADLGLGYQEFPAFGRDEIPDGLPKATTLVEAVFQQLSGQVFTTADQDTVYIGFVSEPVLARDAEFEEVHGTVLRDYIDTEAANIARQRSEQLAQSAKDGGGSLAAAAAQHGAQRATTDFVKRDGEADDLGSVSALGEDAFSKVNGEVQGPVAVGERWVVFRTVEMRPADESMLGDSREQLRQELMQEKRALVFEYFQQDKLREYSDAGLVVRYPVRIQQYLQAMQRVI